MPCTRRLKTWKPRFLVRALTHILLQIWTIHLYTISRHSCDFNMDPISATSSILTLLGAAGGSCKFLFDFLLNLAEAPRDIRTQNERLGCIHETITTLIQTYSQLPSEFQFQPYLKSGLVAFTNKLGKIRAKIETRSTLLQKGRIRSLDESFKWLFYDRKLRKFLASLDEWDMILSQAVMASQL